MSENVENQEVEKEASEETASVEENATEASGEAPQEEQEDFKKKFYYVAAEMENMKKRFEREKDNLLKYGHEKALTSLIDVVDNLDRTVAALEGETDAKILNIVEGVNMVRDQFVGALKKHGLEMIESVGKPFDPNFHEAMAQQPAEGKEDDTVLMEYQKGYVLNGRLLRAAKVIVVKNN